MRLHATSSSRSAAEGAERCATRLGHVPALQEPRLGRPTPRRHRVAVQLRGTAHPQSPLFDYPVLAALVDLDEGVRIVTNLVGMEPADIRIGMRLTVDFEPTSDGGTVPVFRPDGPARRSA